MIYSKRSSCINLPTHHKTHFLIIFSYWFLQIRKCNDTSCCLPKQVENIHWLPDPVLDDTGDHYRPFDEVYGTETNDDNRPGNQPFNGRVTAEEQVSSFPQLNLSTLYFLIKYLYSVLANLKSMTATVYTL